MVDLNIAHRALEKLKIDPNNCEALQIMGNYYLGQNDYHNAIQYFDQVATLYPGLDNIDQINEVRLRLADRVSDLDKAENILRDIPLDTSLRIDKVRALIYKRREYYEECLEVCNRLLDREDIDPESSAEIKFICGDIYDKLGYLDRAMDAYQDANFIVSKLDKHKDKSKEIPFQYIDKMKQYVENLVLSNNKSSPVFLVGFPRSGTTLLNTILDSHQEISCIDEKPTLPIDSEYVVNNSNSLNELENMSKLDLENIESTYWSSVYKIVGKSSLVVDKMPLRFVDIPIVSKVFPKARFIFLVRDPRDCILSCFMQNFEINNAMANFFSIEDSVNFYDKSLEAYSKYLEYLDLDIYTLYYESLINNFEDEVNSLLSYLGLDWSDTISDYDKRARSKSITTPSYSQVVKKPFKSSSKRWEKYKGYMETHKDTLNKWTDFFGYERMR